MQVKIEHSAVDCNQCGGGNEQGIFTAQLADGTIYDCCSECLMSLCVLPNASVVIIGVVQVQLPSFEERDVSAD